MGRFHIDSVTTRSAPTTGAASANFVTATLKKLLVSDRLLKNSYTEVRLHVFSDRVHHGIVLSM